MELNLTVTLVAVFIAVGLFVWGIGTAALERSSPPRRRLNALVAAGDGLGLVAADGTMPGQSQQTRVPLSPKKMTSLQRRLATAGFHGAKAATYFTIAQVVGVAVLGGTPLLVMGTTRGMLMAAFGAILGYIAPGLILDHRISRRKLRIENGLPDALDLLISTRRFSSSPKIYRSHTRKSPKSSA